MSPAKMNEHGHNMRPTLPRSLQVVQIVVFVIGLTGLIGFFLLSK